MSRVRTPAKPFRPTIYILALTLVLGRLTVHGQAVESRAESSGGATVQGFVRDSSGRPIAGAKVCLLAEGDQTLTANTGPAGAYRFSEVRQGIYSLRAEIHGYDAATFTPVVLRPNESRTIELILESSKTAGWQNSTGRPQFFDEPSFTVAGVTDTTNLGGHGSDTVVRNRQVLVQAAVSLSEPSSGGSPVSKNSATEKVLREAVEQRPEGFDPNHQLGTFLVAEGESREGLPYLEKASRLNPNDGNNAYQLARARANSGDYEHARSDVRSLLAV
jgi:Carboxypeptidase regulatory-like domain